MRNFVLATIVLFAFVRVVPAAGLPGDDFDTKDTVVERVSVRVGETRARVGICVVPLMDDKGQSVAPMRIGGVIELPDDRQDWPEYSSASPEIVDRIRDTVPNGLTEAKLKDALETQFPEIASGSAWDVWFAPGDSSVHGRIVTGHQSATFVFDSIQQFIDITHPTIVRYNAKPPAISAPTLKLKNERPNVKESVLVCDKFSSECIYFKPTDAQHLEFAMWLPLPQGTSPQAAFRGFADEQMNGPQVISLPAWQYNKFRSMAWFPVGVQDPGSLELLPKSLDHTAASEVFIKPCHPDFMPPGGKVWTLQNVWQSKFLSVEAVASPPPGIVGNEAIKLGLFERGYPKAFGSADDIEDIKAIGDEDPVANNHEYYPHTLEGVVRLAGDDSVPFRFRLVTRPQSKPFYIMDDELSMQQLFALVLKHARGSEAWFDPAKYGEHIARPQQANNLGIAAPQSTSTSQPATEGLTSVDGAAAAALDEWNAIWRLTRRAPDLAQYAAWLFELKRSSLTQRTLIDPAATVLDFYRVRRRIRQMVIAHQEATAASVVSANANLDRLDAYYRSRRAVIKQNVPFPSAFVEPVNEPVSDVSVSELLGAVLSSANKEKPKLAIPTGDQWAAAAKPWDKSVPHWNGDVPRLRPWPTRALQADGIHDEVNGIRNLGGNVSEVVLASASGESQGSSYGIMGGNYRVPWDESQMATYIPIGTQVSSPAVGFRLVLALPEDDSPTFKTPHNLWSPLSNERGIDLAYQILWATGVNPIKPDWQRHKELITELRGNHVIWEVDELRDVLWGADGAANGDDDLPPAALMQVIEQLFPFSSQNTTRP